MAAEVDGYDEVPLGKVIDLVIPIRAVAGPACTSTTAGV
jgi:hypothetical protein